MWVQQENNNAWGLEKGGTCTLQEAQGTKFLKDSVGSLAMCQASPSETTKDTTEKTENFPGGSSRMISLERTLPCLLAFGKALYELEALSYRGSDWSGRTKKKDTRTLRV